MPVKKPEREGRTSGALDFCVEASKVGRQRNAMERVCMR